MKIIYQITLVLFLCSNALAQQNCFGDFCNQTKFNSSRQAQCANGTCTVPPRAPANDSINVGTIPDNTNNIGNNFDLGAGAIGGGNTDTGNAVGNSVGNNAGNNITGNNNTNTVETTAGGNNATSTCSAAGSGGSCSGGAQSAGNSNAGNNAASANGSGASGGSSKGGVGSGCGSQACLLKGTGLIGIGRTAQDIQRLINQPPRRP